jgi:hypothetical protein
MEPSIHHPTRTMGLRLCEEVTCDCDPLTVHMLDQNLPGSITDCSGFNSGSLQQRQIPTTDHRRLDSRADDKTCTRADSSKTTTRCINSRVRDESTHNQQPGVSPVGDSPPGQRSFGSAVSASHRGHSAPPVTSFSRHERRSGAPPSPRSSCVRCVYSVHMVRLHQLRLQRTRAESMIAPSASAAAKDTSPSADMLHAADYLVVDGVAVARTAAGRSAHSVVPTGMAAAGASTRVSLWLFNQPLAA